jgi:hypothetical protein
MTREGMGRWGGERKESEYAGRGNIKVDTEGIAGKKSKTGKEGKGSKVGKGGREILVWRAGGGRGKEGERKGRREQGRKGMLFFLPLCIEVYDTLFSVCLLSKEVEETSSQRFICREQSWIRLRTKDRQG